MSKQQENKKVIVDEIVEVLKKAKSFILFEYTTLTGKQITELRKQLYVHNSEMHVYKNTLLKRALAIANITVDDKELMNANAIILMNDENIDGFKDLANTLKKRKEDMPEASDILIKLGYYEAKIIDGNTVKTIASLPSRNDLYSMIASALQSPLTQFAYAIKQIADTKNSAAADTAEQPAA